LVPNTNDTLMLNARSIASDQRKLAAEANGLIRNGIGVSPWTDKEIAQMESVGD